MPSALGNFFMKALINSPIHSLLGDSLAVITFKGRKSGRRYSTPINVVRVDNAWTVVSLKERTWWRNLRNGGKAELRLAGQRVQVRGEVVEDRAEVLTGLTNYFSLYPGYIRYFDIHLGSDGQLVKEELERAAEGRVLIRLRPDSTS
jgi:deazaflavin-dependent oxidoreductase (nitroreductase family)